MEHIKNRLKIVSLLFIAMVMSQCKNKENGHTVSSEIVIDNKAENSCIDSIIEADIRLGKERDEATKIVSISQSIENYVNGIKMLDFKNCPDPFQAAFRDHRIAWEKLKEFTDDYPSLRGEMHELFDKIKKENKSPKFNKLLAEVWRTWEMVEAAMAQF